MKSRIFKIYLYSYIVLALATFNYSAKYRLFDTYDLFFNADNIFDQNYEEAYQYSTMGRTFNFGIRRVY